MSEMPRRTRATIMAELLHETNVMLSQRNNADVLIEGVEKRQALMDEFDALPPNTIEDNVSPDEIRRLAAEILQKDKIINSVLEHFFKEAKIELSNATNKNRVIGYANQAIADSGSYMDYKK